MQEEKASHLSETAQICMRYLPATTAACAATGVTKQANKIMDPKTTNSVQEIDDCVLAMATLRKLKLASLKGDGVGETLTENYFDKLHRRVVTEGEKYLEKAD